MEEKLIYFAWLPKWRQSSILQMRKLYLKNKIIGKDASEDESSTQILSENRISLGVYGELGIRKGLDEMFSRLVFQVKEAAIQVAT